MRRVSMQARQQGKTKARAQAVAVHTAERTIVEAITGRTVTPVDELQPLIPVVVEWRLKARGVTERGIGSLLAQHPKLDLSVNGDRLVLDMRFDQPGPEQGRTLHLP